MLDGIVLYLMSRGLLDEYFSMLRCPARVRRHRCTDDEMNRVPACLVANSM
ncbi:MAG: hypothetical protein OXH09_20465 [Gammaproteobacteria bacterium]|nr:hypothetical protein [Gammaproteobacteria bacterium]